MDINILKYAQKNINISCWGEGIKAIILSDGTSDTLYIETDSGKNFKLSDDEIVYQAQEWLEYEIRNLENQ